jgi:glucose-1-phosphate cytidylyltransferase
MYPVVILCGGQGTRMGDTLTKKELVDIGGRPLLWHVMRIFSAYGYHDFVLALGHLGEQVRRYFLEYEAMTRDVTLRLGHPENYEGRSPLTFADDLNHLAWNVSMVDTGLETEKGSRIGRVAHYIANADRFFVAYGEAVADIDLDKLLAFHLNHGRVATISGIQVNFQYGIIEADDAGKVSGFAEKPPLPYWINGGYMLFERSVLDLLQQNDPALDLEKEVLPRLAREGELMLYRHTGYWQSMKTLKDALTLKQDWQAGEPWRVW